jgi:hypothetical protein
MENRKTNFKAINREMRLESYKTNSLTPIARIEIFSIARCLAASSSKAGSSRMGQRMGKRDEDSLRLPFAIDRHRTLDTSTAGKVCASTGCGRNSELIINKNNILLKVIDTTFSYSPALHVD